MRGSTIKIPDDIREKINSRKGRASFSSTFVMLAEIGLAVKEQEEKDLARVRAGKTQLSPEAVR